MTVGWAKLPGTAIMLARPRAILPTRSSREAQELPHPLIPADTGIQTLPNCKQAAGQSHVIVRKAPRLRLPLPACGERVGVRGHLHKLRLAERGGGGGGGGRRARPAARGGGGGGRGEVETAAPLLPCC
jgi:hypothetical protein